MADYLRKGGGHVGYCKLCSLPSPLDQDEFDKRAAHKDEKGRWTYSTTMLNDFLKSKELKPVARKTIQNHREHVLHPRDRVVSAIQKRQQAKVVKPNTSHDDFLKALIDIGNQRIQANPEEVTIDQALKAAQIQAQRDKKGQVQNVLVQLFTQGAPTEDPVVEGEVREV